MTTHTTTPKAIDLFTDLSEALAEAEAICTALRSTPLSVNEMYRNMKVEVRVREALALIHGEMGVHPAT